MKYFGKRCALLTALALAAGCKDGDEPIKSCKKDADCDSGRKCYQEVCVDPRLTRDEFVEQFAVRYCGKIEDCCGHYPALAPDEESCRDLVMGLAAIYVPEKAKLLHVEDAGVCLYRVEHIDCDEANDARLLEELFFTSEAEAACGLALVLEDVEPGSACAMENTFCHGTAALCLAGVCEERRPEGEACCAGEEDAQVCSLYLCADGLGCDADNAGDCAAREENGAACAEDFECLSFNCAGGSECESATFSGTFCALL